MFRLGVFVSLVCAAPSMAAAERIKIAVLDLEPQGVEKATAATLDGLVVTALKKLSVFDVLSRSDIQALVNFEESKQLVGCRTSSACIAELGGALGVARLLTGGVGKLGNSYVLTMSLFDAKVGRVIERDSRTAGTVEGLAAEVDGSIRYLVRALLERQSTDLLVRVSEPLAEIEVDGLLVGLSPLPRVRLPSGPHKLRVSKRGFITVARDVVVEQNGTPVEVALVPSLETIRAYDQRANGMRAGAYVAGALGIAMIATGFVLFFGVTDPMNTRHNAEKAALDIRAVPPSDEEITRINARADQIQTMYRAAYGVGIAGGVVAAAAIVLFAAGPKPGLYDQYKTVEIDKLRLSFDAAPTRNGAFATMRLTW